MVKTRNELIKKYIEFFESKGHAAIPSGSLIPENDPTVLFTTAGMHPLVPYILGEKHPLGKRLVNVQKCLRTGDLDEVGDRTHGTFFEMLGNWSLGDYWKREAINFTYEFLTKVLGFERERLAVTVFKGDAKIGASEDVESAEVWKELGFSDERIAKLGKEDNWWGPAGESGPCGPCSEIFYWTGKEKAPKKYDPSDKRWVEIGNNVFMEFNKKLDGSYELLKQKNVDFGGGLSRQLMALNGLDDIFKTDLYSPIVNEIEQISGKSYGHSEQETRAMRIIADHITSATMILGDDKAVKPSNTEQGYILRRLIRRAVRYGKVLGIEGGFTARLAKIVIKHYPEYTELTRNKEFIFKELEEEEKKFERTLEKGLKELEKLSSDEEISGKDAFLLFQSYGFPIEMTIEMAREKKIKVDEKGFREEYARHQELSRSTSAGMFKSGLADHSEKTTRLHTATHLLNEALTRVLGEEAAQRGSNITPERTRFDFTFSRKLTDEEVKEVEDMINRVVEKGLDVMRVEMDLDEAFAKGAKGEFGHKYPSRVSVFTVVDPTEKKGYFSREICTGPHVKNTREVGKFKILKQESVSSGVRRIKASVD